MIKKLIRLLIVFILPFAAYSVFSQWLAEAPVDNSIRITLLVYMGCVWLDAFTDKE